MFLVECIIANKGMNQDWKVECALKKKTGMWIVDCGISFPRERKTKIMFTTIFQFSKPILHLFSIFFSSKLNHMSIIKDKYFFLPRAL